MEELLLRSLEKLRAAVKETQYCDIEYQEALMVRGEAKINLVFKAKERLDSANQAAVDARTEYESILERAYMQYLGR